MMLPLYIFTDQARKYTACLKKHDSGMFGHMANENRKQFLKARSPFDSENSECFKFSSLLVCIIGQMDQIMG